MKHPSTLIVSVTLLLASCQEKAIAPLSAILQDNPQAAVATKSNSELSNGIVIEAFPSAEKTLVTLPSGVQVAQMDSLYILQGDIVLSGDQLDQLTSPPLMRAAITSDFVKYWPNHTVYYTYSPGFSGAYEVQQAISAWESQTGLDFVYGTGRGNYIEFKNNFSGSYYSNALGMNGGRQEISLYYYQIEPGIVIHEIGHAIGLFHEHCRSDRDDYITVCPENIANGGMAQFQKNTFAQERTIGPFDFGSIMLYNSYQASWNGLPTMVDKEGNPFDAQIDSLSHWDLETVKAIYGPPYHTFVCEVTDSYYQDYGVTSEQWGEQCDYSIKIFSDKACTIPASLQYYRKIKVRHTIETIQYGNVDYSFDDRIHIIPAGTSEYYLGHGYTEMYSDYGVEFGRREYYSLIY